MMQNNYTLPKIITTAGICFSLFFFGLLFPAGAQQNKEIPQWQKMHYLSEEEMHIRSWDNRSFTPTDPAGGPIYNVAEFAQMEAVLIRYPLGIPYSLVAEMSQDILVTTIVTGSTQENTVRDLYENNGVNLANCNFIYAPSDSYWTRDYGPWFIIDSNYEFGIVDFPYNRPRPNDDNIPVVVASVLGINLFGMDVVHTGGNYMTDFYGKSASTTLVYTENADPSLQNPPLTPQEVDSMMSAYLGLSDYHVLDDPLNEYIEHIDCWGKFLDVDKVLIGQVPSNDARYGEFESIAAYFEGQTSGWGKPYEVYRVFTPGTSPGTPYTNSLIVNNKVFVPQTGSPWDGEAIAVYEEAMPGYEIIGTFAEEAPGWQNTDAIHCRAKGIADREMLWIRHMPLWGTKPQQDSYPVQATVVPMSGANLNSTAVKVYYRINSGSFTPIVMFTQNDTLYTASIPGANENDVISYFITATDQAGNTANHPYIGSADPHQFRIQVNYQPDILINEDHLTGSCLTGSSITYYLLIHNTGNMQLNYQIEPNTVSYEHFPYQVPDSPSPTAFTDNTYEELGWTEVAVGQDEIISQWSITYDWYTMYPGLINGASFWVESPQGTIVQISGNLAPGTYTVNSEAYNGENMLGTWKLWIEDSFHQGGHQATNITMTLRKTTDPGPWLDPVPSSGFVVPGGMTQIEVEFDASTLDPGQYNGQLIISSNDQDEPQINLPVLFTVQGLPYLTLSEDSLIFLSYHQMLFGQEFTVKNPTPYSVQINEIEKESWGMFMWYIEPWNIELPYILNGGDSLTFNVHIAIPVLSPSVWMVYDTLTIESQYDFHEVIIGVDFNLISGTDNDVLQAISVRLSPNPFSHTVSIDLDLSSEKPLKADILDFTGQRIKSFGEFRAPEGKTSLHWDGTSDAGVPVPGGVYFVYITSEGKTTAAKLILTR